MTSETETGGGRLMEWARFVFFGAVYISVWCAIGLAWPISLVAGGLQVLGIVLAALGVDVVRSSLEHAANKTVEAKAGLDRWSLRRQQLQRSQAGRHKTPMTVTIGTAVDVDTAASITPVKTRGRVERERISDRDWLTFLDNRVDEIFAVLDQAEQRRSAERSEWNRRLGAQRDDLLATTRRGWQLIVGGLACSAVGTALRMAA